MSIPIGVLYLALITAIVVMLTAFGCWVFDVRHFHD
jgi:hypothetical protein